MPNRSKSSPETSGRCLGASPDTCLVPIAWHAANGPIETRWLFLGVTDRHGYTANLNTGSQVAAFLRAYLAPGVLKALRKELGNG